MGPPEAPPRQEADEAASGRRVLSETRERDRRYRRAVAIGVIVSVAVHLVAVLASSVLIRRIDPDSIISSPVPTIRAEPEGMQAVDIRVVERPEIAAEPEPEPEPEPVAEREPARPTSGEPAEPTLSAAERLRPRVGDWRLWAAPPPSLALDRSEAERLERVQARIVAAIQAGNDSLAAELLDQAEAMDWTVGEDGNRWGISPGKVHLGPVTLPLPLIFGPHPATAREQADRAADWSAIQRQAGQGAIDETFEERVKAIRERKARERAEKAEENDTTSSGGG